MESPRVVCLLQLEGLGVRYGIFFEWFLNTARLQGLL